MPFREHSNEPVKSLGSAYSFGIIPRNDTTPTVWKPTQIGTLLVQEYKLYYSNIAGQCLF